MVTYRMYRLWVLLAFWSIGAHAQSGDKIIFQSTIDGNNKEIFSMDLDGNNLVNLTNHPRADEAPACSPDGTKIAFISGRGPPSTSLFTMNADGSNKIPVIDDPTESLYASPAWSPNGQQLAVVRFPGEFDDGPDSGWNIYLVHADGSNLRKLGNEDLIAGSASWSLDGQQIAVGASSGVIYIINADGTDRRELPLPNLLATNPIWSPVRDQITFAATPDVEDWTFNIYVINADGSGLRQLSNLIESPSPDNAFFPSWSPDGDQVIYSASIGRESHVYIVGVDGQNERRITSTPMSYIGVCWLSTNASMPTLIRNRSWAAIKRLIFPARIGGR